MGQRESLEDVCVQKEDVDLETTTSPLPLLATEAGPILHPKDQGLKKCGCPRLIIPSYKSPVHCQAVCCFISTTAVTFGV